METTVAALVRVTEGVMMVERSTEQRCSQWFEQTKDRERRHLEQILKDLSEVNTERENVAELLHDLLAYLDPRENGLNEACRRVCQGIEDMEERIEKANREMGELERLRAQIGTLETAEELFRMGVEEEAVD